MMVESTGSFVQKFVVDPSGATAGLRQIDAQSKALQSTFAGIGKALLGLFAVSKLKGFADGAIEAFHNTKLLAQQMGATMPVAAAMRNAFVDAGVGADGMSAGMTKWAMSMTQVRAAKPGEMTDELKKWSELGPAALTSFPGALQAIAAKIRNTKDEQQRLTVAMGYFGEQGRAMLPVLMQGPAAIEKALQASGGTYGPENARKMEEARIATIQLNREWSRVKTAIGMEIAPIFPKLVDGAKMLATHAGTFAAAAKLAAGYFAGMKLASLAGLIGTSAAGLGAAMGVGGAAAAAVGSALPSAGERAYVAGPMGVRNYTESAAAYAARQNAALAAQQAIVSGAGVPGIGAGAMGMAKGLLKALPWVGLGVMALDAAWDKWGSGKALADSTSGAASGVSKVVSEAQALKASRAQTAATEKAEETMKRFTATTGMSTDRLAELGITTDALAQSMKMGGAALVGITQKIMAADYLQQAKQAGIKTEAMVGVSLFRQRWIQAGRPDVDKFAAEESMGVKLGTGAEGGRGPYSFSRNEAEASKLRAQQLRDVELGRAFLHSQQNQALLDKIMADTTEATKTTNNFNGPITIKQEFRDQDPDRIIFSVIDELARLGENRVTARTAHAFSAR